MIAPNEVIVQTKILVIDDDKEMTDLMKLILEPGLFEVITVNSSVEGVEQARASKPDVVVLDLLMPAMDGLQVCKEIRKFSQVPILVLSAVSKPGMASRALDEGADDYLLKPMPSSMLIAHIKKLARRARAEQESSQARLSYYA